MTELVGIAWDHPRGVAGLRAVQDRLAAELGTTVRWETHSLADFSAASIADVAARYDLVVYDHPFVGDIAADNLMVDLTRYLSPDRVTAFRDDAVGHGIDLFTRDDRLWGLPIDAAVQVAAFRPDLCARVGLDADSLARAPFEDIVDRLNGAGFRLATSFSGVGSIMVFFTLCNQLGAPPFATEGEMVPRAIGERAIDVMRRILEVSPPEILDWESIAALEAMARRDDLAWCPCVFGFSAYAMDGYGDADGRWPLAFTAGPVPPGGVRAEGIIGGAGVGVSSRCAAPEAAVAYIARLFDADIQRAMGLALAQPGRRSVWQDTSLNAASRDFYANTLQVMDGGYIRPRWRGWVPRQDAAGDCLEAHLRQGTPAGRVLDDLHAIFFNGAGPT